ncbi:hypothetical protein BAE44_0014269 [Dichanthelium oligosanthes]|uniref:Uncharacterized protein n=1 Tax=Dichanthelium oligosanthes TaxID=888268 RepID=A0A1E5VHV2_9POAL|nr:hypothetical protein BAE44_0014269 [Dichanthelium oligosanthes]
MGAGLLLGDAAGLGAHLAIRRRRTRLYLRSWAPAPLSARLGLGAAAAIASRNRGHVARFAASASGGGDEPGELSEDEAQREWEAELNRRLKEAEEMEELERTAEQLQSQAAAEAPEESEEEKRERVRRELQKIQIWLAMAYEANRRHKDCIALYKELESSHPMINIRRQAAELRYILEAPKLKISNDEVVTIPQIGSSWDWYAGTWSDKIKEQEDKKRKMSSASNQIQPSPNIFGDFSFVRLPSEWKKSAWVVVTLWILLIGTAIYLQT